jgi:hypothetical protein
MEPPSNLTGGAILMPMAQHRTPDREGSLADRLSEVQVTIVTGRRGGLRARIADVRVVASVRAIVGLMAVVAVVGVAAIVVSSMLGERAGSPRRASLAQSRRAGPAGVAAAYRYPLRCLSVTISSGDGTYARADLDRATACGRYGGYVTAIFHRIGGAWRPVLDATNYSCPTSSLPMVVQVQLAVCPPARPLRAAGPGRGRR